MKKLLLTIAAILIILSLTACGGKAPCDHIDEGGDYVCDLCGEALERDECTTHVDTDGDLYCDECGEDVPKPECTTHIDADGDLHCDECGKDVPKPECTTHIDDNGDRYCDVCQEKIVIPACKTHSDVDNNLVCDICDRFADEKIAGWLLSEIPSYKGGTLSSGVYLAGQGMNEDLSSYDENLMQAVANTNASDFAYYLSKLTLAGYEREFYREVDTNLFASYANGTYRVYAYFMARTKEARIVMELESNSVSIADFEYAYENVSGAQTVLYQYSVAMNDATHDKADGFKDNGMFYIIKLPDNSVIIIDGANYVQFPDSQCENLMNMLWSITGTEIGGTVRIAAWYITHAHGDHFQGFRQFTVGYSKYLDLERVVYGLPSTNSPNSCFNSGSGFTGQNQIIEMVDKYYSDDDPIFLRLHTGQTFEIAGVIFDVLYTHEDAVNASTGASPITSYNDASTVVKLTIDGESFLILGDIGPKPQNIMLANWSADRLKADAVQMAHHVMNDVSNLYNVVSAEVVFIPQSRYYVTNKGKESIIAAATAKARADMIFYQNEYTVGIAVVDGKWEKVYTLPVIYEAIKP